MTIFLNDFLKCLGRVDLYSLFEQKNMEFLQKPNRGTDAK